MKKLKAFTLIETIIVILVFSIGILVVLKWLASTIRHQDNAETQIKTSFLAREWIELMFNLRDANYHKEMPWNCIFVPQDKPSLTDKNSNPFCIDTLGPWKVLKISMWTWNEYIHTEVWNLKENFDDMFNEYQIYFHTWTWNELTFSYDYTGTEEEKTPFARYLIITGVMENWILVDTWKLLKIESHVLYKKWFLTWDKFMETFIGNYEF